MAEIRGHGMSTHTADPVVGTVEGLARRLELHGFVNIHLGVVPAGGALPAEQGQRVLDIARRVGPIRVEYDPDDGWATIRRMEGSDG
jgi:hypothetical protein